MLAYLTITPPQHHNTSPPQHLTTSTSQHLNISPHTQHPTP
ncbi:hypothetical protein [Leyella stercorea]|nr:hypothetical protein [Leyella stercorea]